MITNLIGIITITHIAIIVGITNIINSVILIEVIIAIIILSLDILCVMAIRKFMGNIMAMAAATISADTEGAFLLHGFARDDTWSWAVGGVLYASVTTGELSQSAPVGSADVIQVVGVAISATVILFVPNHAYGIIG